MNDSQFLEDFSKGVESTYSHVTLLLEVLSHVTSLCV